MKNATDTIPTSPSLGRLLISHITLRGPELAQLYAMIRDAPGSNYEALRDALIPTAGPRSAFGLDDAPLREALNFLIVAGLVEQQGPSRLRATFRTPPDPDDLPFAPLLLRRIGAHDDERQRALALIHRELIAADVLAITPAEVRDRMERGPLRSLFMWTGEKIALWGHLSAFFGLIRRPEREAAWLLVPTPGLMLDVLAAAKRPVEGTSLAAVLDSVDSSTFACYTSRGRVHRGVAQTLLALDHAGRIQLTHAADAARSVMLGERRVSDVVIAPQIRRGE